MKSLFSNLEEKISITCLTIMTILIFANVVSRYVLNASFAFSEEITVNLFVLLTLLGASIAARRGAHLGVSIIVDRLNLKTQNIIEIIGTIISIIFSFIILYYGIIMVRGEYVLGQVTATMQWPEWIFGSFVPIGGFVLVVRYVLELIKLVRKEA